MPSEQTGFSPRLAGRHILITGAASGIGLATARCFAKHGAKLALLDRTEPALRDVAKELGAFCVVVDLQDESAVKRAVADSAAAMKAIDGVVNAAGIFHGAPLGEMQLADWTRVITVNLTGTFLICRETLPHLKSTGGGTIVNISSGQGIRPTGQGMGAYSASKGGIVTFTKSMAAELGPSIRVNVVCPGPVDTPLLTPNFRVGMEGPDSRLALKRIGATDEIAEAILYLTSRESSYVTGIALAVDGGSTFH